MTHITIAAVTIFLHRHQAHRALDLHPLASHFFRFWLWLTTGMITKEWASIHRKHHAKCETVRRSAQPADLRHTQSPVRRRGALPERVREIARRSSATATARRTTGSSATSTALQRRRRSLMLVVDFVLFGFIGVTIWAVQMMWIPFLAAGVVNGIGHYWGYRTFQPSDASRNIVPWGILIGGEELHNNHHAYVSSARLSNRWYEFDIGWLYIRVLQMLGLARGEEGGAARQARQPQSRTAISPRCRQS